MEQKEMYNKLKKLLDLRNNLLVHMEADYNRDTLTLNEKRLHLDKSKLIVTNQNKEMDRNDHKMGNLESDILTLRKQILIGENDFKERSFKVFFLKNIFIFLLSSILVCLLVKNNNISMSTGIYVGIVIASILLGIFGYNLCVYNNRNNNIFHKNDWEKPTEESLNN